MGRIVKKKVQTPRRSALAKRDVKAATPVGSAIQILEVAAALMRQKGYEATTIRDIAREVGIKAASVYHHFPSKDDIVQRVVIEGTRVVCEAVAEALAALPPLSIDMHNVHDHVQGLAPP